MKMKGLIPALFLVTAVILYPGGKASSEENKTYFDLGIGGGSSLNGLRTQQIMIAPAISIPVSREYFTLRVEADLEMIFSPGKTLLVGGISPMLRAVLMKGRVKPFIEIGPGVNYATHRDFKGRHLTGPVFFSGTGGLGVELTSSGRPISISYRARHLSNGHIKKGWNQGLNSQYIMVCLGF